MTATTPRLRPRAGRRGFSLPEILMAVFILAVGVISIAALLPAGIAQQQRSVDDVLGPVVAEHALDVIRSKVSQEDFGSFEEFEFTTIAGSTFNAWPGWGAGRPVGDWGWLRPAFVPAGEDVRFPRGAIDLFNAADVWDGTETRSEFDYARPTDFDGNPFRPGLPFSTARYGFDPPRIFITREERSWPTGSAVDAARNALAQADLVGASSPQYFWECMFQRQGGRVRVAIMVYRVVRDEASRGLYETAPSFEDPSFPPLPHRLDLLAPPGGQPFEPFDATVRQDSSAPAPRPRVLVWDEPVTLTDPDEAWTLGDQWMVDQNGFVHRVLFGRDPAITGTVEQEVVLQAPVPELPYATGLPFSAVRAGVYELVAPADTDGDGFVDNPGFVDQRPDEDGNGFGDNGLADENVVSEIWYLPVVDRAGRRIVPVYCTVREL